MILTETGRVFSWGDNRRGQLGHSTFETLSTPRLIHILALKKVVQIGCGAYFSLCMTEPGVLYTWGSGDCLAKEIAQDVLGSSVASTTNPQSKVVYRLDTTRDCIDCSEPQTPLFFQRRRVQAFVAGENHVSVISAGELIAWGSNSYGQLGIGNVLESKLPITINFGRSFSEKELLTAKLFCGGRHMALLIKGQM
jgi:alpha-tubulin suppressor-like RCC1 family protein